MSTGRDEGSCRRGHMMSSSASRPGPSQPSSADALLHVAGVGEPVGEENTRLQDGRSVGVGCIYEGLIYRHRGDRRGVVQLYSFGGGGGGA